MKVIPVNFSTEHKNMLSHLHLMINKEYLAIPEKFDKLIVSLRTAYAKEYSIAIEEFRTIASNLRDLDNEAVNEGRVRLRDLSHELEILLEQADNAIQEASLGL